MPTYTKDQHAKATVAEANALANAASLKPLAVAKLALILSVVGIVLALAALIVTVWR